MMIQFFTAFILTSCFPVLALAAIEHEEYFHNAAHEMQVPVDVVKAISRVESRGQPYLLTIAGKRYMCDTKTEALIIARKAHAEGKDFDVGMMQVNNSVLSRYGIPLDAALDPAANILLGAYLLRAAIKHTGGDLWAGVGLYDSPNPKRAEKYVDQVRRRLSLFEGSVDTPARMYNTDWWDGYREALADAPPRDMDVDEPVGSPAIMPVLSGESKRRGRSLQVDTNRQRNVKPRYAQQQRHASTGGGKSGNGVRMNFAARRGAGASTSPVERPAFTRVAETPQQRATLVVYRGADKPVFRRRMPVETASNTFVRRKL